MAAISTKGLTRTYGARRGVEDINLFIPEGSLYGFLGPNGAGKTTTIRVLLGFLRPTAGRASVLGLDCWTQSARIKRDVGYVPGDLRLWPWMTGRSALSLFGSVRRMDLLTGPGAGNELADFFELSLNTRVRAMSRGMRQKLGLILAMAHRPKLLVLDEPTSGLDPLMQDRFRDLLRSLSRKQGTTIFFSSHTLSEVEALCDRVAIVRAGKIVADSTLRDLQRQAGRHVIIRWNTPQVPAESPACLTLDPESTPLLWQGRLIGSVDPLISWLNGRRIDDITIQHPDLETLFRQFYQSDSAPTGQAEIAK